MHLAHVQPGMILGNDILDERGHLLLEKGIKLTAAYISRLKQLDIRSIHIADPIAELLTLPAMSPELRNELSLCFHNIFTLKANDLNNQTLRMLYCEKIDHTVSKVIAETEKRLPQIMNVKLRQASETEVQHGINVCLLSLVTGMYLKLPHVLLKELALGALFHDIGKTIVPPSSISEPDPLRLHPLFGRELLFQAKVGSTAARIAAEHHENFDGTGFPSGLAGKDIHPLSRLVAVANYYDTALAEATLNDTPRQEIVESMMSSGNTRFDLNSLRAFFHTVAVFPVGCLVKLSINKTGYVIKNSTHYPLRPVVRIFDTCGYVDVDLVLKPNVTIAQVIED